MVFCLVFCYTFDIMEDKKIKYVLKRNALSKSVRLSVQSDGQVVVTAPRWVSVRIINKFVNSKEDWIKESLEKVKINKNNTRPGGSRAEFTKYQKRAKQLAVRKVKEMNQFYNFDYNKITIRFTSTRWGSCSSKKNLNFNYRIIFLSENLANYLVVHELCHLEEMNHSAKFWKLVEKAIPDYQERRQELKKVK